MASFDVPSANPPISVPAHLVAIGPSQVFAQVPWELHGQTSAQLKVTVNCSYSNVVTVALADYAPAWFERTAGVVFAVDANGQAITATNPAKAGQSVTLIANGLGPVTNQPDSGDWSVLPRPGHDHAHGHDRRSDGDGIVSVLTGRGRAVLCHRRRAGWCKR
jgi:uncharacterized protein (TIGR03437 family)